MLLDFVLHEDDEREDTEESLCWLKNNIEPWGQVELFWRRTFKARQSELKDTTIYNYYAKYRVLRENRGFTLVSRYLCFRQISILAHILFLISKIFSA